jgi:hypothetical protein
MFYCLLEFMLLCLHFMIYRFNALEPGTKVPLWCPKSPTNSSNACHTPLSDDHIKDLEFKLLVVVSGVVWQGCHNLGGDFQEVHSEKCFAYSPYYGRHEALAAKVGPCFAARHVAFFEFREAFPEARLVADPDASVAFEPYEETHDTMAKSYLNPAEPSHRHSPFHCWYAAEEGYRHYKIDGGSHGVGIHDGRSVGE